MEIRINAKSIASTLLITAVLLTAAHIGGAISTYVFGHGRLLGLVETFDLNNENNVPTFYSTFLHVTCAAILAVIGNQATITARDVPYWRWLSLIFLFLAVDEDASLHELLTDPLKSLLDLSGPLLFAWVIPYGIAVLVLGLLYLRFVLRQPLRTRRLIISAGCVFVAGALGFELIGGWYLSLHGGKENLRYLLLVAAEEFLEMSGLVLFIYTLLDFLSAQLQGNPLRIFIRSR